MPAHILERILGADPAAVGPVRGEGHERVAHRDHATGQWNCFATQAIGVAGTVPSLVVTAHYGGRRGHRRERLEQLGPDHGMAVQQRLIAGGKSARVQDHVVGQADHPDVTHARADIDRHPVVLVEAEQPASLSRELADERRAHVYGGRARHQSGFESGGDRAERAPVELALGPRA